MREMEEILGHLSARRIEQAGAAAQALVEQQPEHGLGWKALGLARQLEGRTDEALAAMKRAVDCLPGDIIARCNLGQVLLQNARLHEALAQSFWPALAMP